MSEPLQDLLQPVLVRWTMGGAAAALAPDHLRDRLGDEPEEAELRLLAIAGQALGLLVTPEPSGRLQGLPDLPALPLPTLPERLRPLAARVLARNEEATRLPLLRLLEERGYVVHPSDWMPSRTGSAPAIYAPWQDWLGGIAGDQPATAADLAARWNDYGPAGRRMLLGALRDSDPSAALALIRDKAPGQPAETRLWMVQALAAGLSEQDREFLESLSTDRAPSVKMAASRLLRRLGGPGATQDATQAEAVRDVADFLRVETKGVLRKQRVIAITPARSAAQVATRTRAMNAIDVQALAAAIGLEEPELPAMWPWGQDLQLDTLLATMILGTGTDVGVAALEQAVASGAAIDLSAIPDGLDRLSPATVKTLATRLLRTSHSLAAVASALPKPGIVDEYDASPAWRSTILQLQREQGVQASTGTSELLALGVIVTSRAAGEMIDQLARVGVPSADPRLDTLRINAAL